MSTERIGDIELAEVTGVESATAMRAGEGLARLSRFPDYYLGPFAPQIPAPAAAPPPQQRHRLPRSLYPAIADRARCESLRDLAAEYGVSHETIRAVVRRAMPMQAAIAVDRVTGHTGEPQRSDGPVARTKRARSVV